MPLQLPDLHISAIRKCINFLFHIIVFYFTLTPYSLWHFICVKREPRPLARSRSRAACCLITTIRESHSFSSSHCHQGRTQLIKNIYTQVE